MIVLNFLSYFSHHKHPRYMNKQHPLTEPKAKNKKQIAEEMGIHPNTLSRRLKDAGLYVPRGFVSPQQQQEIYQKLGWAENR